MQLCHKDTLKDWLRAHVHGRSRAEVMTFFKQVREWREEGREGGREEREGEGGEGGREGGRRGRGGREGGREFAISAGSLLLVCTGAGCGCVRAQERHDAQRPQAIKHLLLTGWQRGEGRRLWPGHLPHSKHTTQLLPW